MTQLVFALIVTMGSKTISVEHWNSIDICLYYANKLNSQHTHIYHRHHPKESQLHAKCIPARVDPRTTEIFTR